jgi:SanA protein
VFIAKNHEMDVVAYNAEDVGGGKTLTHFRELFAKTLVLIDLYILNRGPKFL